MRPRGNGDACPILNFASITRPDDARLAAFAALLMRTFSDPNSVLGLDRMQQFLAEDPAATGRNFNVLVAEDSGQLIGGSVFSYVPASNCGFSEYLVLDRAARGHGLGRKLFDQRSALLDRYANPHGHVRCRGLFIEVDSPERTPPEMLAAEQESSIDAVERLRIFGHLGFKRVDVAYVQPPLDADKQSVDYLDLLFVPSAWSLPMGVIPVEWILKTLEPIWTAWTPALAPQYLSEFHKRIGSARLVSLLPV